jgi:hypothetical protein
LVCGGNAAAHAAGHGSPRGAWSSRVMAAFSVSGDAAGLAGRGCNCTSSACCCAVLCVLSVIAV